MQSRIKEVRKALHLSQEEFANKIGFTRGAITNAELGRAEIRPQFVTLICNTFQVNEHWLRTGEGEMFNELSREEEITRFVARILRNPDASFKRALIVALAEMPDEAWELWADFVLKLADEHKKQSGQPPED